MAPHRNHVEARSSRVPARQYVAESHDHKPDAPSRMVLLQRDIEALTRRLKRRADLVEPLVEALRAHDACMAENFNDGPDSKALHPKAAANWKRVRAALSSWEAAQ